ncbi:MAG: ORF6N domain-containing protein [Bacilli bacterium]
MNEIITKDDIKIENMIYEINGKQVMLDSDLAKLYNCKNGTKEINQAVKNNIEKFPERYSWKLTEEESRFFLVKNFDQNIEKRGSKYNKPRVFTEQGITMLAGILKSELAVKMSLRIVDTFIAMRKYINISLNNTYLLKTKY